jgi:hypothetical protein
MAGPLIRPPTKKQIIVGAISFAIAVVIMALAGATGKLSSEVQAEREAEARAKMSAAATATPEATAAEECLDVLEDLTEWLIATQDQLRQAAEGGDYSKTDLDAASEEATKIEDKGITRCEDADPASADRIHAAIDATQDAADASTLDEEKAAELLDPVAKALELAE